MKTGIAILGAMGSMGRAVARQACTTDDLQPLVFWDRPDHPGQGKPHPDCLGRISVAPEGLEKVDVVIDFSAPESLAALIPLVVAARKPLVSGTTGVTPALMDQLKAASQEIPVLWAPNMSLGVLVLRRLCQTAMSLLGPESGFEVELLELHHRKKKDSPSGTAVALLKDAVDAWGLQAVHGRNGLCGPRNSWECGVHAVRGGDVVGEHTMYLLGCGERLELSHRAWNRDVFAGGALFAARRLPTLAPGLYNMDQILGENLK
jgi:4-hydroxy-tetrahydrodipicolinate reductase